MINPWLEQIYQTLPRLMSLFDTDPFSPTKGQGDRYRWAWKLIDFGNGTFQGAAHGLSRLLDSGLLPSWLSEDEIIEYIDLIFHGTKNLIRPDNSLEEAFPNEGSFCVTALVAFDLLSSVELLDSHLTPATKDSYLKIIKPLICFLDKNNETHAFISNHLATAAAAMFKWGMLTNEKYKKAQTLLNLILDRQSDEGWYLEYEGADPGYMSLCIYYLADIHRMTRQKRLAKSLDKAADFLTYAAHPDGSFGGEYGSRNTRFYYPAGVAYLASVSSSASDLHKFMCKSATEMRCAGLASMDEPNLIPMFNAYAWAAAVDNKQKADRQAEKIPAMTDKSFVKYFKEAGLIFVNRPQYYLAINTHKGGTGAAYYKDKGKKDIPGALVSDKKGKLYTTQLLDDSNDVDIKNDSLKIVSKFRRVHHNLPSPFQFVVLRLLCLSLMRSPFFSKWIKKALVWLLITRKQDLPVQNKRVINLKEIVEIKDEILSKNETNKKLKIIHNNKSYRAYHMASSGYWQRANRL